MRPDEHKKKKNTAYKKKHGIPNKGGGASAGDEDQEQKKKKDGGQKGDVKGKGRGQDRVREFDQTKKRGGDHVDDSSTSSSEDEIQHKTAAKSAQKTKAFKRREIVSNWQKYELEPEQDEKVTTKGEDFEKLLNQAGSALSHFRFKDEIEWESGLDNAVTDSQGSDTQFLSINPARLTESLSCLPVHQVLGLSPAVFPDEQLASMTQTADEKRQIYSQDKRNESLMSPTNQCVPYFNTNETTMESERTERHPAHATESTKNLLSSTLAKSQSSASSSKHPVNPSKSKKESLEPRKNGQTEDNVKTKTSKDPSSDSQSQISAVSQTTNTQNKDSSILPQPNSKPKAIDDASIEDDLDFLLSLDSPQQSSSKAKHEEKKGSKPAAVRPTVSNQTSGKSQVEKKIKDNTKNSKEANPQPENEDLEDWLDSVLDS